MSAVIHMMEKKSVNKVIARLLLSLLMVSVPACSFFAQERKVMNRPYIDTRVWHYGFLFGMHVQDMDIANNGVTFAADEGHENWYADVRNYSPGFSVGVLGELRLNEYLSLRLVPTIHFGDKKIVWHEQNSSRETSQIMKSTYLSVPIDLKLSAPRFNNYRPYIMAGVNPTVDLTVKEGKEMLVRRTDCMLEVGLGMDLYFPYFKLIPELKFCFGLSDILVRDRSDLTDMSLLKYSDSMGSARNRMIALTLYFE